MIDQANDTREVLFAQAAGAQAEPLWTVMDAMVTPQPRPKAVPHLWAWETMRPYLIRAGDLVDAHEAERRVFMLVNPAMRAPYTTDTLYAGLQLIRPGETARAHRHTAFALRFIIEGERGFTAVGGEKVVMGRGDLVLTPSWNWHDHGHEGDGPMIWLDGLDLPLFQAIPINFAEPFEAERYPSVAAPSSALRFPWAAMQATLDAQTGSFAQALYTKPDGSYVSKTLGAAAERCARGVSCGVRRETASSVYHVVAGEGRSRVGGTQLAWRAGDTFAVPAWTPFEHTAHGETAYLFRFDDRPLLDALGFYRADA
jgi:gentisate 1,2-dioxygenase